MEPRRIVYNVTPLNTDVTDLALFEKKVKLAKEAGATHILVTEVEKSRWIWERDRTDPYPNWGMLYAALFKIVVPEELKAFLPEDYARRNLELVKARTAICRRWGLKGAACFTEPFYLPEEVYEAHPDFRGPRCEHPRRARNAYFCPCVDNPAVRDMYRRAMRRLCEAADIDYVYLYTDDSGGGICWSDALYPGPNGPAGCQSGDFADRVAGFLRAFRLGAADAGRSVCVEISNHVGLKVRHNRLDEVWSRLDEGMAANYRTREGTPLGLPVDVNYEYTYAPVRGIPLTELFLEQLERGWKEPCRILRITVMDDDFEVYFRIARAFFDRPTDGYAGRVELLRRVAAEAAGESAAPLLLEAWHEAERGRRHFFDAYNEGLSWCSVNQRLITRPFVFFPAELTEEEKGYYRPFQFQAGDEAHADDLMDNQCTTFIRGPYAAFLAIRALNQALACDEAAAACCRRAAMAAPEESAGRLRLLADRFALLQGFIRNYRAAIGFQNILDSVDSAAPPEVSPRLDVPGDPRLPEAERILRGDIDNTYAVIRLVEGREREMLVLAPTAEQEDCFWLSPAVTDQLRRRIRIMGGHLLDGKRLFVSRN